MSQKELTWAWIEFEMSWNELKSAESWNQFKWAEMSWSKLKWFWNELTWIEINWNELKLIGAPVCQLHFWLAPVHTCSGSHRFLVNRTRLPGSRFGSPVCWVGASVRRPLAWFAAPVCRLVAFHYQFPATVRWTAVEKANAARVCNCRRSRCVSRFRATFSISFARQLNII